jgi:hypothetical protein
MFGTLLQVTGEFTREEYQRNFQFLFYGLLTAWLVLLAFVIMLAGRERRLRRELERLRLMIEDRGKIPQ